jgi:hypothetical protein
LRQKISGGFPSEHGAKEFAVIPVVSLDRQGARLESAPDLSQRLGALRVSGWFDGTLHNAQSVTSL